jgi:hypothetical protein
MEGRWGAGSQYCWTWGNMCLVEGGDEMIGCYCAKGV